MTDAKNTAEAMRLTDLIYLAYGSETGVLFGIPADLRGSVETVVEIAIKDTLETAAELDQLKAENESLVQRLKLQAEMEAGFISECNRLSTINAELVESCIEMERILSSWDACNVPPELKDTHSTWAAAAEKAHTAIANATEKQREECSE